jgi:GNAT superfamily N-acetyltransferase
MPTEKPYANLLEASFPGIKSTIARCEALGFSWEELCGRVFVKETGGEVVSHVAALSCRVLLDKRWHKMVSLHAVCTKKDHRGQGLASDLLLEVLQWAKHNSDFQILFTEIPAFYERLGFASIKEQRFGLKQSFRQGTKLFSALSTPKDDDLFLRCFRERAPLSQRCWIEDRGEIASFTTLFGTYPSYWSLYYCPEFDGFLSWFFEDKTLHLLDIVATKLPSLEQILEYLPQEINQIYFYFPTDSLDVKTTPEPHLYDKGQLMVHGSFPLKEPFMIAPLSRC